MSRRMRSPAIYEYAPLMRPGAGVRMFFVAGLAFYGNPKPGRELANALINLWAYPCQNVARVIGLGDAIVVVA